MGGLRGIGRLGRARLAQARAIQQGRQTRGGSGGINRFGADFAGRRLILPLLQSAPDIQPVVAPWTSERLRSQGSNHGRRPRPPGSAHRLSLSQCKIAGGGGHAGELIEQARGAIPQRPGLSRRIQRRGQTHGEREAHGRWGAELGGPHKGEQLQHIHKPSRPRRWRQAKPPRGHRSMGDQDRTLLENAPGFGCGGQPSLASDRDRRSTAGGERQGLWRDQERGSGRSRGESKASPMKTEREH